MSWDVIKKNLDDLPRAQKKIALFMLENQATSIFMTAAELGEQAAASETSAIRLACTLGYENFPDFLKDLREEASDQLSTLQRLRSHRNRQASDSLVSSVINTELAQYEQTGAPASNDAEINRLAQEICAAPAVYIIGLRSTRSLAVYLEFYLSWFFPRVFVPNIENIDNYFTAAPRESLVIAMSFPRYTRRTVELLSFARKLGLKTAAITDAPSSPLVKKADISVFAPCAHIAHIDSLFIPMGLINTLLLRVSDELGPQALERLEQLESYWEKSSIYF